MIMRFLLHAGTACLIASVMARASLAQAPVAPAATPEQLCVNASGQFTAEQRISGCTAAILSGKYRGAPLATYYTYRAVAYDEEDEYEKAVADYLQAIRLEPTLRRHDALCSSRSILGQLDLALADCNAALKIAPRDADALDSRGFVYLKLGRFDEAIIDYNAALSVRPSFQNALFGRGIARLRTGDTAGGNADIAAAKALEAEVAERFGDYGVVVTPAAAAPVTAVSPPGKPDCSRAETHWKTAEELRTVAGYEDHLARFGACDFATLARARIETLKK
jgi:tetratricopeptide (TPR) repeat protein